MNEKNFFRNYTQIITAANYCIAENLTLPALILIYSSIDSISWMASDDENQLVGERFQIWVNTWMLQKYPLPCTAEELYAARCGILHTLTPYSDLSEKKCVRKISYAWGKAKQKDLANSIKLLKYPGLVAVHVNDIFNSFTNGFIDFIKILEKDEKMQELFMKKASKHFANTDISTISELLDKVQKDNN